MYTVHCTVKTSRLAESNSSIQEMPEGIRTTLTVHVHRGHVTASSPAECPVRGLDLVFAFDSSGSVGPVNFSKEKEFAANVSSIFNIGLGATQVGAVSFSGITYFVLPLNTFISGQSLREGLTAIEYNTFPGSGPNTNTSGALRTIRGQLFTEEGGARPPELAFPRVVIVITDGRSNVDQELTLPAAAALHDDGVIVFAVGIGREIRVEELEGIASDPSFVSTIGGFNVVELRGLQSTLSVEACRGEKWVITLYMYLYRYIPGTQGTYTHVCIHVRIRTFSIQIQV